jgi:hypothetical protein
VRNIMSQILVLNFFILVMDITHGTATRNESHSSPGRFFAVNEIKLMLAFIMLRYDVRTKDDKRPEDIKFAAFLIPDMKAEILFKKRSN